MSTFETQAEIYQALLEGKKLKHKYSDPPYIFLKDGNLVDDEGDSRALTFMDAKNWSLYEEPKPMKRVEAKAWYTDMGLIYFSDVDQPDDKQVHNPRIEDGRLVGEVEGE